MRRGVEIEKRYFVWNWRGFITTFRLIEDDNISYYVDNNKDKVGKVFRGKEIISVCQLKEIYTEYEIVVAVGNDYIEEIGTQLDQLGIPYSCLWDFPFIIFKENVTLFRQRRL